MRYYSTRGRSDNVNAAEAILKGLATDGGLYVPADRWPLFTEETFPRGNYQETAKAIFSYFLSGYSERDLNQAVSAAYNSNNFEHPTITPLKEINADLSVLELWHGPTYAFKDIALQILPHLMTKAINNTGQKGQLVILTATSGDTGKSALEGFHDIGGLKIVVYYPEKGVSDIQKLQMVTQVGHNVEVAAVKGNFDDAQKGVKAIFADDTLNDHLAAHGYQLSSANSINWGRLLPQIVYYFSAYNQLVESGRIQHGDLINFVVPTGNFGNILAGFYARKMGLPVHRLICAANQNNVLTDFINSGTYDSRRQLHQTISPSMDILISSNLERLLFELNSHDPQQLSIWMRELAGQGHYQVDQDMLEKIKALFWSGYAGDRFTKETIAAAYHELGYLMDPHTAVGKAVLDQYREEVGDQTYTVILSTASPYKFADSVIDALEGLQKYAKETELTLLQILAKQTGLPIPPNLASLSNKEIKHDQVIAREAMSDHLLTYLKLA